MVHIHSGLLLFLCFCALFQVGHGAKFFGEASGDYAGTAVEFSSSGSVLAMGSPNHDNGSGHVRVYERLDNNDTWIQRGTDLSGDTINMRSGSAVALSETGAILAFGSPYAGDQRGHVHVYEWKEGSWMQLGDTLVGLAAQDFFGCSVSMSANGMVIAVGARLHDGNGDNAGHVQVFAWSVEGKTWIRRGEAVHGDAEYDGSGFAVSLSADGIVLAIGAPAHENYKGHVRTFEWEETTDTWVKRGSDIIGVNEFDFLGWSIDLSADGRVLAVSAPYHNADDRENSGQVKVFHWMDEGEWQQLGNDINGDQEREAMGNSVALSPDGNLVAVGLPQGRGSNGLHAGHAKLFQLTEGKRWVGMDMKLDGEVRGDRFGHSVSLSSAGNLAVGVRQGHSKTGRVETFSFEHLMGPMAQQE